MPHYPLLRTLLLAALATTVMCVDHPNGAIYNRAKWVELNPHKGAGSAQPVPPASDSWKDPTAEIFVTITNYRDEKCGETLKELFEKAQYPDRVFVGVVQQRTGEDADCIARYCALAGSRGRSQTDCPHAGQIRSMLMSIQEAKGPIFARAFHGLLAQDEEFCLQIDSHTAAVQHWDSALARMWGQAGNEYAVLSTSPQDISAMGGSNAASIDDFQQVPHLCHHLFTDGGIPRNFRATSAIIREPLLAASWSPAVSFSKCHLDDKVPYDPNLPNVNDGEEFTRYARMWTAGYDVYTPPAPVFYHDYRAPATKKFDSTEWIEMGMSREFVKQEHAAAVRRMQTLLGVQGSDDTLSNEVKAVQALGRYGLGTKRTLDQLIDFTGVDVRAGVVFKDSCNQLEWVPTSPDAGPRVQTGDVWGRAPEPASHSPSPPAYREHDNGVLSSWAAQDMLATLEKRAMELEPISTGWVRAFVLWLSSLVDPLTATLRAPFVAELGPVKGERTFKIFLATVPIFMGFLLISFFALLPEAEREEPFAPDDERADRPRRVAPHAKNALFDFGNDTTGLSKKL